MNWSSPTEYEHSEAMRFIASIRRSNVIMGIVTILVALVPITVGIFMIREGMYYAVTLIVVFVFFIFASIGMIISDRDREELIKNGDYKVCRCRVAARNTTRAGRSRVTYYVSVQLDDGGIRKFKATRGMYYRAKEGEKALVISYKEDSRVPTDVIVLKETL